MMRLPSMRVLSEQERLVMRCRRDVGDHLRCARQAALDQASRPCSMFAAFALGGVLGWKRPGRLRGRVGQAGHPVLRAMVVSGFQLGLRVLPYLLWRVRVRRSYHADVAEDPPPID